MNFVIAALIVVVVVVGVTIWLLWKSIEECSLPWMAAVAIWFVALLALGMYASSEADNKGPCVEYRTDWYWNAAAKTMMPAKICVARAEWVKP